MQLILHIFGNSGPLGMEKVCGQNWIHIWKVLKNCGKWCSSWLYRSCTYLHRSFPHICLVQSIHVVSGWPSVRLIDHFASSTFLYTSKLMKWLPVEIFEITVGFQHSENSPVKRSSAFVHYKLVTFTSSSFDLGGITPLRKLIFCWWAWCIILLWFLVLICMCEIVPIINYCVVLFVLTILFLAI